MHRVRLDAYSVAETRGQFGGIIDLYDSIADVVNIGKLLGCSNFSGGVVSVAVCEIIDCELSSIQCLFSFQTSALTVTEKIPLIKEIWAGVLCVEGISRCVGKNDRRE